MKHVTLASALVTAAIAVPAGWHALSADIQSDGPQMRPKQQVLELDGGTSVTLDLDRGVMLSGGNASVTLVATSDHPHKVAIALRAMENMGYGRERIENPPLEVDSRTVTLDAQPGGGVPVVATFRLAKSDKTLGRYKWFDIVASPVKQAKDDPRAAQVGLATWSGNSFAMAIEPPVAMPAEGGFSIAVRVKNTTKKPMHVPDIRIGGRIAGVDGLGSDLFLTDEDYQIAQVEQSREERDNQYDRMIAPGAEDLTVFRVTPHPGIERFTFVAYAYSDETGAALATATVDRPKTDDAPAPMSTR